MNVKLITDSGANSFKHSIGGVQHVNVPLTLRVDDQDWLDDERLDVPNFVAALQNTKTATSSACPSINDWLTAYEGGDEIFVFAITSALSGSYNSAVQAARLFQDEHPDAKLHVFDSKSAGPQIRLLVSQAATLVNKGFSFEEIIKMTDEQIKHTDLLFMLENLHNLANNGRVKPAVAQLAKMLRINVFGTASDSGEFEMLGRMRGGKKATSKLVKEMDKMGYKGGRVMIDHVACPEKAQKLRDDIFAVYPSAIVNINACGGLCSYYAEKGGLMIGFEK